MPDTFYLRFLGRDYPTWLRRGTFTLGWRTVERFELASQFASKDEARAFARQYHIEKDVELVTVTAEALHAA
jgi:hypothetical protein